MKKRRICAIIKSISLSITIVALANACSKTENHSQVKHIEGEKTKHEYRVVMPTKSKKIQRDTVLANSLGNYEYFLAQSDYKICLSLTNIPHMGIRKSSLSIAKKTECGYNLISDTKLFTQDITINGISLKNLTTRKVEEVSYDSWFGKEANLIIGDKRFGRRDVEDPDDPGEPQLPSEVRITSPNIHEVEDGYPLCYFEDFILRWDSDVTNNNGTLVVVEWDGTMVFGEHYGNTSVRAMDLLDDTGVATLNPHLFDGIPDTAMCYLTLMRGLAVFDTEEDESSYSFICECSDTIPFVLIRNIETI